MSTVPIHPAAVVEEGAVLDRGVTVDPFAFVGKGVRIGADSRIGAHSVISGETVLGARCVVGPHVVLGADPQLRDPQPRVGRLRIGDENQIREFATVHCGSADSETVLGAGNLLMAYAHVAHDCRLGSGNELANAAQLAGHVVVGDGVTVAGLAGIHQYVQIGDLALVGAGAMVSQDVPPFCCVVGDRARLCGLNVVGLKRRGVPSESRRRLSRALRALFGAATLKEGVAAARQIGEQDALVARLVCFALESRRGLCRPVRAMVS